MMTIYATTRCASAVPLRRRRLVGERLGRALRLANSDLVVERVPVGALNPYDRNARTHDKKQVRQIADSIREFGFLNPILIDADGGIVAGHGRVAAAKQIGIEAVPIIRLDHLTPDQLRAYVIADNKLAENADWDTELLALELKGLSALDLSFDLTITGFELPEIDLMIQGLEPVPAEEWAPELDRSAPPVSQRGDLWQMDGHRLLCGDATDPDDYHRLMDWDEARMVITDPPCNVPIQGHVWGLGSRTHREFAMASGEMAEAEFTGFLATVFGHLAHHSIDGSIHVVFMDWRHMSETLRASWDHFAELKNLCVWIKSNGGMGSLSIRASTGIAGGRMALENLVRRERRERRERGTTPDVRPIAPAARFPATVTGPSHCKRREPACLPCARIIEPCYCAFVRSKIPDRQLGNFRKNERVYSGLSATRGPTESLDSDISLYLPCYLRRSPRRPVRA